MKPTSNLITNVRRLFALGRGITVLCAVMIPILIFIQRPDITHDLGEVSFKSPARVAKNTADGTNRNVEIENLRGNLSLQLVTPAERTLHRTVWSVTFGVGLILAFFGCHWICRLCRNVENGEVFSDGNLKLVRRFGWLLIARTPCSRVSNTRTLTANGLTLEHERGTFERLNHIVSRVLSHTHTHTSQQNLARTLHV